MPSNTKMISRIKYKITKFLFSCWFYFGTFLVIWGVFIFGDQCLFWLKEGSWKENTINNIFIFFNIQISKLPTTEWKGIAILLNAIDMIIRWFLNQSLSLFFFFSGMICCIFAGYYSEEFQTKNNIKKSRRLG